MLRCSICNGEVRPHGRTHDIHTGHPICRGPVCQWCYETKVLRARTTLDPGETSKGSGESRAGMWLYISDSGEEYTTSDPRDLLVHMILLKDRDLTPIFLQRTQDVPIPEHAETPEEQLEALACHFAQHYEAVPIPNTDYFNSIWIDFF